MVRSKEDITAQLPTQPVETVVLPQVEAKPRGHSRRLKIAAGTGVAALLASGVAFLSLRGGSSSETSSPKSAGAQTSQEDIISQSLDNLTKNEPQRATPEQYQQWLAGHMPVLPNSEDPKELIQQVYEWRDYAINTGNANYALSGYVSNLESEVGTALNNEVQTFANLRTSGGRPSAGVETEVISAEALRPFSAADQSRTVEANIQETIIASRDSNGNSVETGETKTYTFQIELVKVGQDHWRPSIITDLNPEP